jgi:hypothetical protein
MDFSSAWFTPEQARQAARVREQIPEVGKPHIRRFIVDKIEIEPRERVHEVLREHPGIPQLGSQHPTSIGKPFVVTRVTSHCVSRNWVEFVCEYGDEVQRSNA